jgi:ribulose-5-phosphate 4-epimerase/fuculose-1-phosphate aldolase
MNASRDPAGLSNQAERQARIDLAAAHRLAARFGFNEGIENHLTLLVPGYTDRFYLAPFGLLWSEVCASDLLELDFRGNVVAGRGLVEETALYIHLSVHRLKPTARCVLHTHMPYATALAMLEDPTLEMASQAALGFHEDIAYVDYNGLALDYTEGERPATALGSRSVLVLRNHGVLVTAGSMAQGFERLYFSSAPVTAQLLASTGRALRRPPPPVQATAAQSAASAASAASSARSCT